jgi:5'-nucleotidase
MTVTYDPQAPAGERVRSAAVDGNAIEPERSYQVATLEILAQGGDAYVQFHQAREVEFEEISFASVLERYFASAGTVSVPPRGRLRVLQ